MTEVLAHKKKDFTEAEPLIRTQCFPKAFLLRRHGWVPLPRLPIPSWWVYHISSCFSALPLSFAWEGRAPCAARERRRLVSICAGSIFSGRSVRPWEGTSNAFPNQDLVQRDPCCQTSISFVRKRRLQPLKLTGCQRGST